MAIHEPVPLDQRERDRVTADLDRNMVVLAGAGAGKTRALVERMVAVVASGREDVRRVVGITFTRKAAGEMRSRFVGALRDAAANANGDEARRLDDAIRHVDQSFVGTIHAFCARMLRERPLEAGLAPDFQELDELDSGVLTRRYWEECLHELEVEGDGSIARLRALGIEPEQLFSFFRFRVDNADVELKAPSDAQPDLGAALERVDALISEVRDDLPLGLLEDPDRFLDFVDRAERFRRFHGVRSDADRVRLLRLYQRAVSRGKSCVVLKRWVGQGALARHVRDTVSPSLKDSVLDPVLTLWRQKAYREVVPIVEDLVGRYDTYRRQAGAATFFDLLMRATEMLRQRPDMRRFFSQKYGRFFVDEFQDTDPLQAEMLFYLVGADQTERDWRHLVPEPGRLFIVGDEKQSIYRFRRADVDTFRLVRARIVETGGTEVSLDTSFRSSANLCAWLNRSFEPLFGASEERYQATFARLLEYRGAGDEPHGVRKIAVPPESSGNRAATAAYEAERIADFIAERVGRLQPSTDLSLERPAWPAASPGSFMILGRYKKFLSIYARALEARGVPYDVSGGERIGEAEEVRTLLALLRALYEPRDQVALLSVLRGPLVGASDDELYAFKSSGGRFNAFSVLPDGLEPSHRDRFERAMAMMRDALSDLARFSPSVALERIIDRIGIAAFAASQPWGSTRSGNFFRLMTLVRRWETEGKGWGEIVNELASVVENDEYLLEQMSLETGRLDVVRIMTVHQAKGLEAETVFLVDSGDGRSRQRTPEQHVSRVAGAPYLARPIVASGRDVLAEPPGWLEDSDDESRYQAAEELRLLYVAATRARDRLVVCVREKASARPTWGPLYPALADVPDLEPVAVAEPAPGPDAPLVAVDTLLEEGARRWEAAGRPTYEMRTVTGEPLAEEVPDLPTGRGADYGTLVHAVFESAIRGVLPRNESGFVRELARRTGLETLAASATADLKRFRGSDIWNQLKDADEVLTEVPYGAADASQLVRGTIDLVFRSADGWRIIDFKTQHAETDAEIRRLAERYQPQIDAYVRHWSQLTGHDVVSAGLWLTSTGTFVAIQNRAVAAGA